MMKKLGRNDPCHCGSGLKYKKCCLNKDEGNNVTRITQTIPKPPANIIEDKLTWDNDLHKSIATYFFNQTASLYETDEIHQVIQMWNKYANTVDPVTKKIGVYPAALEYILCQIFGYTTTQSELAAKYDVSVNTLSQRANQIFSFLDELLPQLPNESSHGISPASPLSKMGMEREMQRIHTLLDEQDFGTLEEANAFLQQNLNTKPAKRKSLSKSEQAAELLYAAWDEPNPKQRIKMAQEALLLDPNSVDAYNILAECAAASLKDAAFYYKQGMLAGEQSFGEAFFKEHKGHFWLHAPTRPYMRAKKGYAEAHAGLGNMPEAIKHYNELLELNPNDNQGVRELLLSAYIETADWKSAAKLIQQFDEDGSAAFNYSRILVEYGLKGQSPELTKLIKKAIGHNPYVPAYLQGKKRLPREMPEYTGYGDDREAIVYAHISRHLWLIRPELLQLLSTK
ncbi:SEC-C domain-containing protein [Paenibacillus oenotherae]|uniref:SEC-C domain-containing protein n=1 Tax=Paenibacillus oenotherae TaxID=1435645 RepID=A0ABS7D240_9BACL|nr:SEC-C metal-binding domain-containing protein [Paenibacillus oenotherae]MBW7473973.1 SEC-C domain-containing protein [Paenibacillus oenotherae]